MRNRKTGRRAGARAAGALAAGAAVTVLATACSVHTSTSYQAGPSGSASYRQVHAFVQCVRSHGFPAKPAPRPGGAVTLPTPPTPAPGQTASSAAQAIIACRHLLPPGQHHKNVQINLG
ncbi:MAG: hypothetical protein JO016_01770 [Actinobacteria bacterium]|nr:hypothetical protein [Actinomycetota bacterium]